MSDDQPHDPLIALRAQLDQAIAMAPELARTTRGYVDAYLAEGFTERQALYLATAQILQHPGTAP